MLAVQYLVVFETPWHALNFCEKLHLQLHDVATYRDGEVVYVIDATVNGAHDRIMALAKPSSMSFRAIR